MDPYLAETPSGGARVALDWDDGSVQEDASVGSAGRDLVVAGHGKILKQHKGPLVAPESVISAADVESLAEAVRDPRRCCQHLPEPIFVAPGAPDPFDPELFEADPVHIEVGEHYVHACVDVLTPRAIGNAEEYRVWLERAAAGHEAMIASVKLTDEFGVSPEDLDWPEGFEQEREKYLATERRRPRIVDVRLAPQRPMKVAGLLAAGRDVHALLEALRSGPLDAVGACRLLRAGLPRLLVGLPETEWLEVKREPYDLDAPGLGARIELAQDVARFANGNVHGVLVIGIASKKRDGLDVLDAVRPAKLSLLSSERYRSVIDERLYPTVEGLSLDQVDLGNGLGLLVIEVPVQPEEYKPFLVHGAIVGDRIEGAFISIVRRRGEGSIVATASQIHAAIAAGRALLRGDASVIERTAEPHGSAASD